MKKIRILLAKPGLDGHDRGIRVVAKALRDAGMEVIYTGLHQPISAIVQAAVQEDVDVIGLSVLSGAHAALSEQLMKELGTVNDMHPVVIIGGTIPQADVPRLKELGIDEIFPVGTPISTIAGTLEDLVQARSMRHE